MAGKPAGKNEGMLTQQDEPGCEHQRLPIRAGVRGKLQRLIGRLSRMGTSSALEASRHGSVRLITARWLDAWQVASCDMRMICQFMQVVFDYMPLEELGGLSHPDEVYIINLHSARAKPQEHDRTLYPSMHST